MASGLESMDGFSSSSGLSQAPVLLCCMKQWMDYSKCLIFDRLQKHLELLICEKQAQILFYFSILTHKKHSVH